MDIKYLQVLVMPNDEVLCEGKTIGFVNKLGKYLATKEELIKTKVTHLGEDYSTIEIAGEEYQASLGLGEALLAELNK